MHMFLLSDMKSEFDFDRLKENIFDDWSLTIIGNYLTQENVGSKLKGSFTSKQRSSYYAQYFNKGYEKP